MNDTPRDPLGNAPDKSKVALLLIDVINDFDFPEADELLRFARPMAERIAWLKGEAKRVGIPTIYVNDNFGRWRSDFKGQVAHCLEATHRLGGHNYVLWGGREGYDTLLNTDLRRELDQLGRFLSMVVEHKHRIGFTGAILIEPKPFEPTKHQYDFDVAAVAAFLQRYDLIDDIKVNIEVNHATLSGHDFAHEIAVAANQLALEGTRAEQTVGTRNVLDVLNAEQELLNSQVSLVTARRDAYVAGFQLLNTMGRAEAEDLNLDGGPLYDPVVHYDRYSGSWSDWNDGPSPRAVSFDAIDFFFEEEHALAYASRWGRLWVDTNA